MGDVITWSKLNKIKKLISNLPTSLENNFNGVKESISALANNFNTWKAPWTTARAEKIDTVTANSETIKSTMAKENTLTSVNNNVNTMKNDISVSNTNVKDIALGLGITPEFVEIRGMPHTQQPQIRTGQSRTILNISGKGYLLSASLSSGKGSFIDIKIDGVSISKQIALSGDSEWSGNDASFAYAPKDGYGRANNSVVINGQIKYIESHGGTTFPYKYWKTFPTLTERSSIAFTSSKPLRFERSLELTIVASMLPNQYTNPYVSYAYTLVD